MRIPKSFLISPPNICPKSALKIARLDSSFARHTFTFPLPANFDCDASGSVVVSFLYESNHSFQSVSYGGIQSGFKIVSLCCFRECLIVRHKFPLCFVFVHWWIRNLGICDSHCPSKFTCSGMKFVNELSVLFGKSCKDALEPNSILNESIIRWL